MKQRLKLVIAGKKVELDPLGLPASLEGDILDAATAGQPRIGAYSEEIQPILDPDLRGAHGRARFELPGGTIVTENFSLLEGATPEGAMVIRSSGRVVEGEGDYSTARGKLTSRSELVISPFSMRTVLEICLGGSSVAKWKARLRRRAGSRGQL